MFWSIYESNNLNKNPYRQIQFCNSKFNWFFCFYYCIYYTNYNIWYLNFIMFSLTLWLTNFKKEITKMEFVVSIEFNFLYFTGYPWTEPWLPAFIRFDSVRFFCQYGSVSVSAYEVPAPWSRLTILLLSEPNRPVNTPIYCRGLLRGEQKPNRLKKNR